MTKIRLFAGMLLFTIAGLAQERGTITGTLTDPSGAVVPGVRIGIRNLATNAAYRSASTSAGEYTVPNLPAGKYEVVFEANGLKRLVQTDIELGVSQTVRVDATLQLGATTETISVTAEADVLQKDTASVGQTLQNHQVIDLPLGELFLGRHLQVGVEIFDGFDQEGVVGFAGEDDDAEFAAAHGGGFGVEAKLALLLFFAVAGVAIFGEQGADGGFEELDAGAIVGILSVRRGEECPEPQSQS